MKTLYLPLKSIWYNMIESGIKKEEYRDITPHWTKRICGTGDIKTDENGNVITDCTHVCFMYGYTKRRMIFEIDNIKLSNAGVSEWGFPNHSVFSIRLGKHIK